MVDKLASPKVFRLFFFGRKLDKKLLGNLHITLHSINALAGDAEQKQFKNPRYKTWLFDVKEVMFDAEDLWDKRDYQLTRCEVEAESQILTFILII